MTPRLLPSNAPQLQWEGRLSFDGEGAAHLGFPGTVLRFRISGDAVVLVFGRVRGDMFFDITVDGDAPRRLHVNESESKPVVLLNGRRGALVTVQRRSESWQGAGVLKGLELAPGVTVEEPPSLPSRKLLFIGDSITCGEATDRRENDPLDMRIPNGAHRANAGYSYGKLLAAALSAQCHLVSYGGRGVLRDWQGIRATPNAPEFYERCCPDDAVPRWDPKAYVPDGVVVALGTNDFSRGIPDETEFVNALVEFVRKLRRDFPQACIHLVDSPIVQDEAGGVPRLSVLRAFLDQVKGVLNDPKVTRGNVSHCFGVPGDGHPTQAEQEVMAREILPALKQSLGW